ncbi:MAG: amidohydrolase [Candidatus Dadabacteria bacterium]|nr:MAG: amidohydrolase [Candidatus Dadabacteria bacterium]
MSAERLFFGGPILTMRSELPRAEAVGVREDRIVAVGDLATVRACLAPDAERVDLGGRCLLPGFIDAHHHFSDGAFFDAAVNLHWPRVRSLTDLLRLIAQRAASLPAGSWVIGEGYFPAHLRERRPPTIDELDRACPEHPVLLMHYTYHEAVVNTRAHERVGLPLVRADPPGGEIERDRRGRPTGRLIENAVAPFFVSAIAETLSAGEGEYLDRIERYQARCFAAGLTRVYDAAVSPRMERAMRVAAERGTLRIGVSMMVASGDGMFSPPRDRLASAYLGPGCDPLRVGALKLFMDGGERAAVRLSLAELARAVAASGWRALARASLDPLRAAAEFPVSLDWSTLSVRSGILFYGESEARELVEAGLARGFSIAIHAEGNEAIERALRILPPTRSDRPPGVFPHRIEHFFFPDEGHIGRAADARLAVAAQPLIVSWVGDRLLDLGIPRVRRFTPLRSMLDAGLIVAGSSDAPVVDLDPLAGIRAAVTRETLAGDTLGDGQEIRVEEALEMYTLAAARAGGLEAEAGTLEPGKRADFVVLSADPTEVGAERLDQVRIERTVCGGRDEFVRSAAPPSGAG